MRSEKILIINNRQKITSLGSVYEGVESNRSSVHIHRSSVHTERASPRYAYEGVESFCSYLHMHMSSVHTERASLRPSCVFAWRQYSYP